jgi:hypothetical protein
VSVAGYIFCEREVAILISDVGLTDCQKIFLMQKISSVYLKEVRTNHAYAGFQETKFLYPLQSPSITPPDFGSF